MVLTKDTRIRILTESKKYALDATVRLAYKAGATAEAEKAQVLVKELESTRDGDDHDGDAHKYGNLAACRVCAATKALAEYHNPSKEKSMNIKDVLHLHVGCEFALTPKYNEGMRVDRMTSASPEQKTVYGSNGENYDYDEIKPVLRPLSSMTEEEAAECLGIEPPYEITKTSRDHQCIFFNYRWPDIERPSGYAYSARALYFNTKERTPKQFAYLLSRHFDLFNLIPSGQAIDSATVNSKP